MNTILRTVAAVSLLLGLAGPPANAAGLNVTCEVTVLGAVVVPNRQHAGVGGVYGTDVAAATISCVSLTGDNYKAWVDVEIYGCNGTLLRLKDWGSDKQSVGGVAVASTQTVAGGVATGYSESCGAGVLRTHRAQALGYIAALCWPSCGNELKAKVSYTYPA